MLNQSNSDGKLKSVVYSLEIHKSLKTGNRKPIQQVLTASRITQRNPALSMQH